MKPTIKFIQRNDGVKLAYSSFGQGSTLVYPAPWVTNLDFFLQDPVSLKFWMRLANHFTVVLYDKHGCGQSDRDRKDFTLDADILDLKTIIESLELKDITIFGISAAGPLSIVGYPVVSLSVWIPDVGAGAGRAFIRQTVKKKIIGG